ncbi:hypothetical protein QO033_20280 [Pseudodonghicola sp. IC7]|jgi:hypothetical protein|uniref:Uncharacterized protein n=1 Tax=Pseudodonghicola flavimaris TaxID=3050036 RepID=A0ABT7F5Z2_9RHOB|nr:MULTISPECIES: hypothetical protein [Rhodobacterales]MDK3020025.1 hypothetical protein [Pseudodonghicola flavimaris]
MLQIERSGDAKKGVQCGRIPSLKATQGADSDARLLGEVSLGYVAREAQTRKTLPDFMFDLL